MHYIVLHNDIAEAAADALNNPPKVPVLTITHQNGKLPGLEGTEDESQYVSCQGMCTVIFQQLAEIKWPRH